MELSLGNRKEVTATEREELALLADIDEKIASGDSDWLSTIHEFLGDNDIDDLSLDDDFFRDIDKEQNARGE